MLDFFHELAQNQFFSGLVGSSLVVSALYVCKGVPKALWTAALWRWTTTLTIHNEDPAFERVLQWLASLEYTQKARKLQLGTQDHDTDGEAYWSPGLGTHLIWHNRKPVLIQRVNPKEGSSGWRRLEHIDITTLGTTPKHMHVLIEEILDNTKRVVKKTEVYLYNKYWRLICRKAKRPLSTVVVPSEQRDRILKHISRFISRRAWYLARGIPYRLGFLFKGPPGCGKTSLVLAIAGHFSKPVYALNLGSLKGDDDLFEAITRVPEHAILLIEDIDAAKVSATRTPKKEAPPGSPPTEAPSELTLSGLLNAFDGAFTKDGRILIMTTNHPESIDPALLREGRVDYAEVIEEIEGDEVLSMCQRFLGPEEGYTYAQGIGGRITPAKLQSQLLMKDSTQDELDQAAE